MAQSHPTPARVLSIAGSDAGGGAGIQADLKTMAALGCHGMSAITAITVQNTLGVRAVQAVAPALVASQIDAVIEDIGADAVKIGMLPEVATVHAVAEAIRRHRLARVVLDPVAVASSGDRLIDADVPPALMTTLLPRVTLLTPNLSEAASLAGHAVSTVDDMRRAAQRLRERGAQAVLIKGGHLDGPALTDLLLDDSGFTLWTDSRIDTRNTHGTGCTLSSAIACGLARGLTLVDAISQARTYLRGALQSAAHWRLGQGRGPLDHAHRSR
ncbi:MAG: bifunctional hydroxymethylpyrimidine kinase/phosphomethylpyrimidine kinase [Hydrogenophaga sp.]|uniref:bifunctional hydroxymethylpyrimidine kinase/phosphomethylpyrimidine kinase n=1 Tax=Hydrogenophaga sp. TaxID=1904254 RepID=UPI001D942FAB|nr:bifunctional hydroxymethylpyrimidine kinase/phosphomethylpyrimidine kinase [Hydrogenophaga sp.]MBX3609373.1 bifunctional hydroxymethylpyrimidine kinase/phosphomethylpyrimidine kinase [Hydrogenophaga sp.]